MAYGDRALAPHSGCESATRGCRSVSHNPSHTVKTSCTVLIVPGLVDSSLKLHLLLLFYRNPRLSSTAGSLSEWLRECPWGIEEAAEALADAGFLARVAQRGRIQYRLEPSREWWTLLERLATYYDDPLRRDEV